MKNKKIDRNIILQKKYSDDAGLKYISFVEFDICNYVISQLSSKYNYNMGNSISTNKLISRSINEMKLFGLDIYNDIYDKSYNYHYYPSFVDDLSYCTMVGYKFDKRMIVVDSGSVKGIRIPSKFYDLSVYLLTHEYIHALKDVNYYEHINMNLVGEVIPIFYELVNSSCKYGNDILAIRFNSLMDSKKLYEEAMCLVDSNSGLFSRLLGRDELYRYYVGVCSVYLNSFYYAVILYNMYKENPVKILDMISKVLKHEITTLEMLELLGLYGDIRGSVFEKEVNKMKKRMR